MEDDFHAEVFPPDFPSFLLVWVVQLFTLHQLPVVPEFENYFNSIIFIVSVLSTKLSPPNYELFSNRSISILDEERVEPKEEGTVVIANRDAFC